MTTHPVYYATLLRRQFDGDPDVTPVERRELDLHLLICPQCNYDYAELLMPRDPHGAQQVVSALESTLTADMVTPYLRDLARTVRAGRPLSGFQRLLWRFLCRDREAMGRFRLLEADAWLHDSHPCHTTQT